MRALRHGFAGPVRARHGSLGTAARPGTDQRCGVAPRVARACRFFQASVPRFPLRGFASRRHLDIGMKAVPGLLAFLVGAALLGSPWWSSTLGRGDYPLVIVLGAVFAAIGIFAALPDSWPRLRTLSFSGFMAAFGLVCAALTFSPRHPSADGTFTIGGIAGFATAGP